MTCPGCLGQAVVASEMRNAPGAIVWTCSSCGSQWSEIGCETRNCKERAVARCVECEKYRCAGHGLGRSGVCSACIRRIARLTPSRGPRYGRWSRTGGLHQ